VKHIDDFLLENLFWFLRGGKKKNAAMIRTYIFRSCFDWVAVWMDCSSQTADLIAAAAKVRREGRRRRGVARRQSIGRGGRRGHNGLIVSKTATTKIVQIADEKH
jgi:hypothetical protein